MAEKTVYICDRCGSYAAALCKMTVSIIDTGGSYKMASTGRYLRDEKRSICEPCSKEIIDDLKLGLTTTELNDQMFEAFALPEKDPTETP